MAANSGPAADQAATVATASQPIGPIAASRRSQLANAERAEADGETERVREMAERYFWLFEDSPVGKYICDIDGRVLEVNSALCRLFGTLPDEIVGRTIATFAIDPPVRTGELDPFLRGEARTYSSIRRYRGADGRALRAMVTLGAIRDGSGQARSRT
jgi:PAS domain S-box-containing protein